MARRYSDINRGPLLAQAHAARQAYIARDIAARNAARRPGQRTASAAFYVLIKPFSQTLSGSNDAYLCRTNQRNHSQLSGAIGTHAPASANDSTYLQSGDFNPAKIKLFVKTGSNPNAVSAVTGIHYTRALGQSYSHPFGQAAATDKEFVVYEAISTALRTANANSRISYTPEKFTAGR